MAIFRRRHQPKQEMRVADDTVLDTVVATLTRNPDSTFADIGRRARVSEREMRERFDSLDHLIDLALMRGARRIARSAFLEDGTPAQQIALLVARMWDDQQPVAGFALRGPRGDLRKQVDDILAPVRALAADAVARGAEEGDFRSDLRPETVAWLIEHSTVNCLDALARGMVTPDVGRTVAMNQALSIAGLSWIAAADATNSVTHRLR